MSKIIAAGLMCLGLVTLGVTASRGQEETRKLKNPDLIVVEKFPAAPESVVVEATGDDIVDLQIVNDGKPPMAGYRDDVNVELRGDDLIVTTKDGKIVERIDRASRQPLAVARFTHQAPELDPATREALDKMIAGIKEESQRLASEGKQEEANRKLHSVAVLQGLLNEGPRAVRFVQRTPRMDFMQSRLGPQDGQREAELKKLHERLEQFRAQASSQPDGDAHARNQEEIAAIHKQIAELQHRMAAPVELRRGQPGGIGPNAPGPIGPGADVHYRQRDGGPPWAGGSRIDMLMHKAQALSQAADQLRGAALQGQARVLDEQAEKFNAEARELRSQAEKAMKAAGLGGMVPGGMGMGSGGDPPTELQRSIRELQEQVQQLRKEIGELREILQQRRQ